jgi:PAS domain S-box-containing protein
VVFTLILATAAYNLLRHNSSLMSRPAFGSRVNSLAVDHVFVLALILLSGGLTSPYYPLIFLLIIAVIASYGVAGFALALAGQVVITPLLLVIRTPALPAALEFEFIIKLAFLIIFSLVAEQSVRSRNEESLLESRFTRRIENERQRLMALINSLSNAVVAIDDTGKIYLYNAAALEILNTNRDIVGENIAQLMPLHDDKYTSVDLFQQVTKQEHAINRQDLTFVANDGSEIILDLTISPVHVQGYSGRNWGGFMVVFRDITKQKSLDEERDEFISVTSHELRTPLAIAEANLSTALLPGFATIEPKAHTLITQAHDNIVFLSKLIQDLSTLSRAERGSLKLEKSLVDIRQLVRSLARDYTAQAKAKGLELDVAVDNEAKTIITSEAELREILQNFLTNAIKYTAKGTVTLQLEHHRQEAVITVRDTGIGMSASDKTKIFAKFYRSEDYRTRATGGTGLGLYITKKLAERLGFTISFTSRLNRGSAFSLHLPYRPAPLEGQAVPEADTIAQQAQAAAKHNQTAAHVQAKK